MRRRFSLASLVAGAFAVFALASAPNASAQEQLAASCEPPAEVINLTEDSTSIGSATYAQTFTSALSGPLTRAQIAVHEKAGTAGDYFVEIWSVDAAGAPVAVLATTRVEDADVPVGLSIVTGVFEVPASVVAGNQYAVSIMRLNSTYLAVGVRPDDDCAHTLRGGRGAWSGIGWDMVFRVFVTPPPSAAPAAPGLPSASSAQRTCKGTLATLVGTPGNDLLIGPTAPT